MRWSSFKIFGALAAAGIVAASTSAFTAGNTMPPGGVAGYGQTTSTGAVITAFSQTTALDASRLASVTFTSTTNVTGKTAKMTLKSGNTLVGSSYPCTLGLYVGSMTITCNTPDNPLLNAFDTRGLSVV